MWRSVRARVLLWFVALAGLSLCVQAAENTGNVYGRAVDAEGAGIPGATATLTGPFAPSTTVSDSNGNFRFLKVPPGRYKVTVAMPGFSNFERENVVVTLGKNTEFDAPLRLTGVTETVSVTSATPLLDTRKVQTGVTFANEELQEVPTARDIYALMQQVPGIQLDTVNVGGNASGTAGGPDFTTKGSGNVTYQVDGATITDNSYGAYNAGQARQNGGTNTFFDFDTFQEVEVATGGSLLDLQTPGVTINVVTKRGTNELKGSARYLYASQEWQASNLPQEAIDQEFETNDTRFIREYGAEVGGPIVKDRLWAWGSVSRQDISLNESGLDPEGSRIRSAVKLQPWTAKLNAQLASANTLSLYYQKSDRFEAGTGNGPFRPPATRTTLEVKTDFYKLEDNHVFSPSLFASVFLSHQKPTYTDVPQGGLDKQLRLDPDGVYQNSWTFYFSKNPQYQGNATVSKFFNTGKINHELKFSFNYRRQVNDSATGLPGDQLYADEYYGLAGITRSVRTVYKTLYYTGTLGDTLTAGNLTINGGIRYDVQQARNLPSSAAANPVFPELLPAVQYHGDEGYPFNFKDWQPRVSATYALGKNRTTLLRGSYARFADQLGFVGYQLNGLPITSGLYYYWTDTNDNDRVDRDEVNVSPDNFCCFYNVDPSTAPIPPNAITSDFKTPLTDEVTFGIDRQIFEDFAVSATYTYRHSKNLQYRLPLGANANTWTLVGDATGTAVAENGFTLNFDEPFYALDLPERPTGDLFLNRPAATQTYHGVELSAVKRLSHKWMLRGSVAWNDWKQKIPREAIVDPNNRWNLAGQNEDGGQVVGYSSKTSVWVNARWQFNIAGLYQFPWGINFAGNFFGREGYPQSYNVRATPRGLEDTVPRLQIGKIDQFRLDNVYELDLRVEKEFQLGPVSLTPVVEVFNVTNENTVLERVSRVGTYNFNAEGTEDDPHFEQNEFFNEIVETQSPRILRLGVRVAF